MKKDATDGDDGSIGMLVPSVVFATCVYYSWTAVMNNPNASCNPTRQRNDDAGAVVLGLFICAASLSWASMRTAQNAKKALSTRRDAELVDASTFDVNALERKQLEERKRRHKEAQEKARNGEVEDHEAAGTEDIELTEDEETTEVRQMWIFHLVMVCGALYLSMLLTQWGSFTGESLEENESASRQAMWVNGVGAWIAMLLFFWMRFAPIVCPSRDFSDARDGF